ncbi:MAG: hypothetical protein ACIPMY_06835 [Rickettsia endosymbiont of Pentastiridius leporinus]
MMRIFAILGIIICFMMSKSYANNVIAVEALKVYLQAKNVPNIKYCENSLEESPEENKVIQDLIKLFATKMNCVVNSCLQPWGKVGNFIKYSVSYQEQCGPIIAHQYQLGDNGRGSTFVCKRTKDSVCCKPMGYALEVCFQNGIYELFL